MACLTGLRRTDPQQKGRTTRLVFFVFFLFFPLWCPPDDGYGHAAEEIGIQPLTPLQGQTLQSRLPTHVRPLLTPQEQQQFLQELDEFPPDWEKVHDSNQLKQSERLSTLNRERNEQRRSRHTLLQQQVAFLWSGELRKFMPDYQGFWVALGPEFTTTSWGIVRFKPMGLPDWLVAIPPSDMTEQFLLQQQNGKQIDITVLFIGTLVTDESLIYSFSHDDQETGMILPVVHIQEVRYFQRMP